MVHGAIPKTIANISITKYKTGGYYVTSNEFQQLVPNNVR